MPCCLQRPGCKTLRVQPACTDMIRCIRRYLRDPPLPGAPQPRCRYRVLGWRLAAVWPTNGFDELTIPASPVSRTPATSRVVGGTEAGSTVLRAALVAAIPGAFVAVSNCMSVRREAMLALTGSPFYIHSTQDFAPACLAGCLLH